MYINMHIYIYIYIYAYMYKKNKILLSLLVIFVLYIYIYILHVSLKWELTLLYRGLLESQPTNSKLGDLLIRKPYASATTGDPTSQL